MSFTLVFFGISLPILIFWIFTWPRRKELEEAKQLLLLAKEKLKNPGRYDYLSEKIDRFLNK